MSNAPTNEQVAEAIAMALMHVGSELEDLTGDEFFIDTSEFNGNVVIFEGEKADKEDYEQGYAFRITVERHW